MKFSLAAQIEEIDRELGERKKVYPRLVRSMAMRQSIADYQVARLEAVRKTLLWLQENETEIRAILAERAAAREQQRIASDETETAPGTV